VNRAKKQYDEQCQKRIEAFQLGLHEMDHEIEDVVVTDNTETEKKE